MCTLGNVNNQLFLPDLVNETNLVHDLVYFVNFIYNLYVYSWLPGKQDAYQAVNYIE